MEPIMMSATVALGCEPAAEYRIRAAAPASRHSREPIVSSDADVPDVSDPLATARGMMLGLLLLLAAALPASAAENNVSKLIVQGEGKVNAAPDVATVELGVETQNASASGAAIENAMLMNETISALRSAGIAEKDVRVLHREARAA